MTGSHRPRAIVRTGFPITAITALTLALAAAVAMAQTGGTPASNTSGSKETRGPTAARERATAAASQQGRDRMRRASKIIGMDVINRQGEKVGDIEDIVLDGSGNVAYAVVSTGAFLGVGEKLHAIPWRSLGASPGADRFTLDIDRDALARAPGFDNNSFPDVNDPKWSAENRRHFPVASSAASRSSATGLDTTVPRKDERDATHSSSGRPAGNDVGTR